jgi:hypothetical protein
MTPDLWSIGLSKGSRKGLGSSIPRIPVFRWMTHRGTWDPDLPLAAYGDHDATIVLMFLRTRAYVRIRDRAQTYVSAKVMYIYMHKQPHGTNTTKKQGNVAKKYTA